MLKPNRVDDALEVLAGLDAVAWLQLGELAQRHTSGRLSFAAWECATSTLLERAAQRLRE